MRASGLLIALVVIWVVGCGDATVPCQQTFSGDQMGSFECKRSLCRPVGETYSFIALDSMLRTFHLTTPDNYSKGTYRDADFLSASSLQSRFDTTTYLARGGNMPLAGQSIELIL